MVGGFVIPGPVLEEELFMRGEILRWSWCSFSPGPFSPFFRRCDRDVWVWYRFFVTASRQVVFFRLFSVPYMAGQYVLILFIFFLQATGGNTSLDQSPHTFTVSRSVGIADDVVADLAGAVCSGL